MSAYFFGLNAGHLPRRVARIARKHGAELVNYTDAGCKCGYGCTSGECPKCRRHWFEITNLGEPHNSAKAREVMSAICE